MSIDGNQQPVGQLDWHWRTQLRPRLDGISDAEYFWEPVADCWSIRRRGSFSYATTAARALRQLDEAYARRIEGVRGLTGDDFARPCGPAEGPYADHPMATLVLHINREVIHHGAEIALLRDLHLRAAPAGWNLFRRP